MLLSESPLRVNGDSSNDLILEKLDTKTGKTLACSGTVIGCQPAACTLDKGPELHSDFMRKG